MNRKFDSNNRPAVINNSICNVATTQVKIFTPKFEYIVKRRGRDGNADRQGDTGIFKTINGG